MKICLFDPGIEDNKGSPSSNLGDLIIQEAVSRELNSIFSNQHIIRISTHVPLSKEEFRLLRSCSLIFVGGTNLLSSNMDEYKQWKILLLDALRIKKAILLGVGWWQYQYKPNLYTKFLLRNALSSQAIHSARDSYSKSKIQSLGIRNVLNTGCPTMWSLAGIKSEDFPCVKSKNVLLMLTDYNQNIDLDRKLLELLFSKYEKVYFWPQGRGDIKYISHLNFPVIMLDESLGALDQFINSQISFDYIGTRLHGGVRCLCSKKRSLILEIDNRAREIARDTQLPTSNRSDFEYISKWIDRSLPTNIRLDLAAIDKWKSQFLNLKERKNNV